MKLKEFKGTFPNMDAVVATYPSGGIEGDFVLVDGEVKGWNQYSNQWEQPTAEPAPSSRNTETIYGDLNVHHNVTIGGTLSAPLIRGKNAFCGVFDTEDSLRRHRPNPVPGEWAMVFAYTTPPPTPEQTSGTGVETVEQNSEQVEQSNEETVSAEPVAETSETPIERDVRDITIGFIFIENDGQWVNSGYKGGYDGTFDAIQQEKEDRISDVADLAGAIDDINDLIPETADKDESPLADKHYVDTEVEKINAKIPSGTDSADNKLVNQNGLTQAINNLNAEKEQVAGEDGLSLNITEVHGKVTSIGGSIAMDSEPQQDSNKAVKSGGVATKIKEINDKIPAGTNNSSNKLVNQAGLLTGINNEALARQQADTALLGEVVEGEPVSIAAETLRAKGVESSLGDDIDDINDLIPEAADKDTNQLADKNYVDGKDNDLLGNVEDGDPTSIAGETGRARRIEGNLQQKITEEKDARISADAALDNRIGDIEAVIPSGADTYNKLAKKSDVDGEENRASGIERNLSNAISSEITRAQGAESDLSADITAEETRAIGAEGILRQTTEGLRNDVDAINGKIPAQATSSNQLADKDFVNDSINTATADFKGTYTSVENLIAGADNPNNNDYGYVESTTEEGNTILTRYKYDGTDWRYEYRLNNSGFTAAEWATIRSGATVDDVLKLRALPTNAQLNTTLAGKAAKVPNAVPGHVAVFDSTGSPVDSGTDLSVVYTDGAFDVSAYNNNAKFASLEALLNDERLSTLIPTDVRKGGMTLKFVCSSDNKYVQARCMAQNFTTDFTQWQGVDDEPTAGSDNLVKSGGVFNRSLENTLGKTIVNTDKYIKNGHKWSKISGENDFQLVETWSTDAYIMPIYFDKITNIEVRKADGSLQNTKFCIIYGDGGSAEIIVDNSLGKYRGRYSVEKCYLYWVNTSGDDCYCANPEELSIVLSYKDRKINIGVRDLSNLNVQYSNKDTDNATTTVTYNNSSSLVFSDNFGNKFNFVLSSNSFVIPHNYKLIHNIISSVTEVKAVNYICQEHEITLTNCYSGYLYGGLLPISNYYLNRGDVEDLCKRVSLTNYEWEQGLWDESGNLMNNPKRIRFPYLLKTNSVEVNKIPGGFVFVCWYDVNKNFISSSYRSNKGILSNNSAVYARIGYGNAGNTNISPSILQSIDLRIYTVLNPASEYYHMIVDLGKDYSKYLIWEQGSWNAQGVPDSRTDKIRTPLIKGNWFNLRQLASGISRYVVCWYNNNKEFISYADVQQGYNSKNNASYFRFGMGNDGQTITPDFAAESGIELLCENIKEVYLNSNHNRIEKLYEEPGIDKYIHIKGIPYCIVNDCFNETSGSAPHIQIDEATGLCFVSFLTSHTNYGETRGLSGLSVFPVSQPFKAKNYIFAETGDLDFNGNPIDGQPYETNCLVYRNQNNKLKCRCFFNCANQKLYYRDFDYETLTFDFAAKIVQYNGNDMTLNGMSQIVQDAGYNAWGTSNGIIFTSSLYKNYTDGYIYACIEGNTGNPIVIKSNDNFASCVFVGICPTSVLFECQICELNGTFYLLYRNHGIYLQTTTDFVTYSDLVMVSYTDQRPQCSAYNNNIWLFIPKKVSYSERQCYEIYKGTGTNISTYTKVATLEDEFGVVYLSAQFLNGRLATVFATAPFMFTSNQGKDSIAFYVLPNVYEGTKPISII